MDVTQDSTWTLLVYVRFKLPGHLVECCLAGFLFIFFVLRKSRYDGTGAISGCLGYTSTSGMTSNSGLTSGRTSGLTSGRSIGSTSGSTSGRTSGSTSGLTSVRTSVCTIG